MNKTIGVILGIVSLLVLVVPVLATQLRQPESREWEGVTLDEVEYEEVQFYNEAEQFQLAGMLFVPEGNGPFPAVVFVHGSAPSFRGNRVILTGLLCWYPTIGALTCLKVIGKRPALKRWL